MRLSAEERFAGRRLAQSFATSALVMLALMITAHAATKHQAARPVHKVTLDAEIQQILADPAVGRAPRGI
jgi:hypothetical protein